MGPKMTNIDQKMTKSGKYRPQLLTLILLKYAIRTQFLSPQCVSPVASSLFMPEGRKGGIGAGMYFSEFGGRHFTE